MITGDTHKEDQKEDQTEASSSISTNGIDTEEPSYGDLVKALNDGIQLLESQVTSDNCQSQPGADDTHMGICNDSAQGTIKHSSHSVADVFPEEIVQSTMCVTENATPVFNSPNQQCQSITKSDTSQATESQIPPLEHMKTDSQETPSINHEKDFTKLNAIDSSDSGIGSEKKEDRREVVVIGPDSQLTSSSLSCEQSLSPTSSDEQSLLFSSSSELSLPLSSSSEHNLSSAAGNEQNLSNNLGAKHDSDSVRTDQELHAKVGMCSQAMSTSASNQVQSARYDAKSDTRTNVNQNLRKESDPTGNKQQIHQQSNKKSKRVDNSANQKKKIESQQGGQHTKGRPGKGSPHIVVPDETEADRRKREKKVLKTLYPRASTSSHEDEQRASSNHEGADKNPQTSQNSIPASNAGAQCQSPRSSEASEPSVHLSDDSGPEEFQDYVPSRSASDHSIDEKSQQRGWWTATEVVKKPHHHHHHGQKQSNTFRSIEARAPGRGSPYQPRDRPGNTPGRQNNTSGHGNQFPNRNTHDRGHSSSYDNQSNYSDRNQSNFRDRDQPSYSNRNHSYYSDRNQSNYRDHKQSNSRDRNQSNYRDRQDRTFQGHGHQSQRDRADSSSGLASQSNHGDWSGETPKNYYIGLGRGRGRGRQMQMAAQMQDSNDASRPYSYGRGNNYRKW